MTVSAEPLRIENEVTVPWVGDTPGNALPACAPYRTMVHGGVDRMQALAVAVGVKLRSLPTVIDAGAVAGAAIAATTISANAGAVLRLILLVTAIPLDRRRRAAYP